jgi:hypothetical protein
MVTISWAQKPDFVVVIEGYCKYRTCEIELALIGLPWLYFGRERAISLSPIEKRRTLFEAEIDREAMNKIRKSWTESTERGFRELSCRRPKEAARLWLEADAAFPICPTASDPLQAASRSNAGAARLLLGHDHEGAVRLASAERSWRAVIVGVATLDVPMTGASSSFHFRLAAAVPHDLIEARRQRYRRLAEVALAVTQFNRAFIERRNSSSAISGQASALRPMLSEVLGAASPEVRLLAYCEEPRSSADVTAIYADKLSEITSRPQTFAAALSNECAELESAVALTALLAPPVFTSVRRGNDAEEDDRNMDVGA